MDIRYFCSTWGMELPLKESLEKIKTGGFDGVELGVPETPAECASARALLDDLGLLVIAQQWTKGASPEEHALSFENQYERAALLKPLCVNSHTGQDHYAAEQNLLIFDRAAQAERCVGLPVLHETHRGRALFSAPSTSFFLSKRPHLKLTADFSHWCCVHESLLEDQAQAVFDAVSRTYHVHARVGYSQGPQVPDPRVPAARAALHAHLAWWEATVKARRLEGCRMLTICPEFGPPPYMVTLPQDGRPISNLWEVNCFMRDWLKNRLG